MNLKALFAVFVVSTSIAWSQSALAQHAQHGRYTSSTKNQQFESSVNTYKIRYTPMKLRGGTKLTMISPDHWKPVARRLSRSLEKSHAFFTNLFGDIPAFESSVRLMDEDDFYAETGAPSWTNAMYYRKQIIIPLNKEESIDFENLSRSVRHEYTHAVIHSMSGGKAPGWLDEGIAQWAEGTENPALRPALYNWLQSNKPLPLVMLQGGFTKLQSDMVPAAYAQSLFAANTMINTFGFPNIRKYFDGLRSGNTKAKAFRDNFRLSERAFESELSKTLKKWQHKRHSH